MVAPDDSPNRMVDACPNLQSRAVARGRARGPAYMGDIDRAIRHCVRAMQRVSSIGVRAASVTVTAGPARGEGGGTLAHSCARYGAPKDVRVYSPTFGRSRHLLRHLSRSSKVYACHYGCAMNRCYPYPGLLAYVVRFPNPANDARRRSDVRAGRGPPRGPGPAPDPRARPPAAPPRYGFAVTRPELPTGRAGCRAVEGAAGGARGVRVERDARPPKSPPHGAHISGRAHSGVGTRAPRSLPHASRRLQTPELSCSTS